MSVYSFLRRIAYPNHNQPPAPEPVHAARLPECPQRQAARIPWPPAITHCAGSRPSDRRQHSDHCGASYRVQRHRRAAGSCRLHTQITQHSMPLALQTQQPSASALDGSKQRTHNALKQPTQRCFDSILETAEYSLPSMLFATLLHTQCSMSHCELCALPSSCTSVNQWGLALTTDPWVLPLTTDPWVLP